jgi:hypothetical protein
VAAHIAADDGLQPTEAQEAVCHMHLRQTNSVFTILGSNWWLQPAEAEEAASGMHLRQLAIGSVTPLRVQLSSSSSTGVWMVQESVDCENVV